MGGLFRVVYPVAVVLVVPVALAVHHVSLYASNIRLLVSKSCEIYNGAYYVHYNVVYKRLLKQNNKKSLHGFGIESNPTI